jgi:hypothetical protein
MGEAEEIREKVEQGLLKACKEVAETLPPEQREELIGKCERAFSKDGKEEEVTREVLDEITEEINKHLRRVSVKVLLGEKRKGGSINITVPNPRYPEIANVVGYVIPDTRTLVFALSFARDLLELEAGK